MRTGGGMRATDIERVPFMCPSCEQVILAPESLDGVTQSCPKCRASVTWRAPETNPQKYPYFAWQAILGVPLIVLGVMAILSALADDRPRTNREVLRVTVWSGLFIIGGAALVGAYRTNSLLKRVTYLNPLQGREQAVVLGRLGEPDLTVRDDGVEISTWASPSYSVTLRFRGGICEGVVREVESP